MMNCWTSSEVLKFRVHAGEQNDVHPEFGAHGRLCLHLPVGAEEHYDVESD